MVPRHESSENNRLISFMFSFRVSNQSMERGAGGLRPQPTVNSHQTASGRMAVTSLAKCSQRTLKPQFTPLYLGALDHPALVR